jgi:hypothetical protein
VIRRFYQFSAERIHKDVLDGALEPSRRRCEAYRGSVAGTGEQAPTESQLTSQARAVRPTGPAEAGLA